MMFKHPYFYMALYPQVNVHKRQSGVNNGATCLRRADFLALFLYTCFEGSQDLTGGHHLSGDHEQIVLYDFILFLSELLDY